MGKDKRVMAAKKRAKARTFLDEIFDFKKKPSLAEKAFNIFAVLLLNLLWVGLIIFIVKKTLGENVMYKWSIWGLFNVDLAKVFIVNAASAGATYFFACVSAPLVEEPVFRWHPIEVTRGLFPGDNLRLLTKIIFVSIVFGVLHGGVINIFVQGVGGLLLSYIYL